MKALLLLVESITPTKDPFPVPEHEAMVLAAVTQARSPAFAVPVVNDAPAILTPPAHVDAEVTAVHEPPVMYTVPPAEDVLVLLVAPARMITSPPTVAPLAPVASPPLTVVLPPAELAVVEVLSPLRKVPEPLATPAFRELAANPPEKVVFAVCETAE